MKRLLETFTMIWAAMSLYYLLFTDYTVAQSWVGFVSITVAVGIVTYRMLNEKEEDS